VKAKDAAGNTVTLDATKFQTHQFYRMVGDMETLKACLMEGNNEGKLNIDKLCVVGAEMGAWVAANWAESDWSWPELTSGKQGQDVKALVLLSPQWQFQPQGTNVALLSMDKALRTDAVRQDLSLMFLVGREDAKSLREARRVYSRVEQYHPKPDRDVEKRKLTQDLFFMELPTKLQGAEMLTVPELNAGQIIATFIKCRLIEKKIPWKKRQGRAESN
jgi:alpha-beta hydrolase superfamily lysophospholipase